MEVQYKEVLEFLLKVMVKDMVKPMVGLNHAMETLAKERAPTALLEDQDTVMEVLPMDLEVHPMAKEALTFTDQIKILGGHTREVLEILVQWGTVMAMAVKVLFITSLIKSAS